MYAYSACLNGADTVFSEPSSVSTFTTGDCRLSSLNANDQLILYPNPASDFITLEWPEEMGNLQYAEIISSDGKLIFSSEYNLPDHFETGVNNFPDGIYFLNVKINNSWYHKNIVIQK